MPRIQMRPVPTSFTRIARLFDPTGFENVWFAELKREVKEHLPVWGQFTSTWRKKPIWKHKSYRGRMADYMYAQETSTSVPFVFVEGGTKRMRKAYVEGFIPKTRPGVIQSGPGNRGAVHIYPGWKRGIKERGIRTVIVRNRKSAFIRRMRRASEGAAGRAARFAR